MKSNDAHHVTVDGSKRRLMAASLRYNDTFESGRAWLFSERLLYVDWVDERTIMTAPLDRNVLELSLQQ